MSLRARKGGDGDGSGRVGKGTDEGRELCPIGKIQYSNPSARLCDGA
jgi:hypothetical protein